MFQQQVFMRVPILTLRVLALHTCTESLTTVAPVDGFYIRNYKVHFLDLFQIHARTILPWNGCIGQVT